MRGLISLIFLLLLAFRAEAACPPLPSVLSNATGNFLADANKTNANFASVNNCFNTAIAGINAPPTYLNVVTCGAIGDGSDQTVRIQTCADKLIAPGGGTLFIPDGAYTFSNAIVMACGTAVVLAKHAVITAAAAASWQAGPVHGSSTPWSAGQVQMAFLGNAACGYEVSGGSFLWPHGSANYGGGAAHIIEFDGATRGRVTDVVADGGGDFVAIVGSSDVVVFNNTAINFDNAACDAFGLSSTGSTNIHCIHNTFSTFTSGGSNVGVIASTGFNAAGSAVNASNFSAIDNDITINTANAQCVIINGHATSGTDKQFVVAHNKCHAIGGISAWGYLITGVASFGVIADNECDGGTTAQNNLGCVAVSSSSTGVLVHDNIANNWQAGTQGVFVNAGTGGSIHDNQAFSSGQLLGSGSSSVVEYGNDNGTGNWVIHRSIYNDTGTLALSSGTGNVTLNTANGTGLSVVDPGSAITTNLQFVGGIGSIPSQQPRIQASGANTSIGLLPSGTGLVGIGNVGSFTAPSNCGSLTSSTKCLNILNPNGNIQTTPLYQPY